MPFHYQFMVVLLDLYLAWKEDPELCLGVSMGSNAWDTTSRYNALHLSKKLVPVIKRLHEVGLIELLNGSHNRTDATTNRTTRIRASNQLVKRFRELDIPSGAVIHHPNQETVILKKADPKTGKDRLAEYKDTEETNGMRDTLTKYNALLSQTLIDIPDLEHSFIERPIDSGPNAGEIERVSTLPERIFVRRIFSRGSWFLNGRFYGGWWQQVDSATRAKIHLNDRPTVEVDFRGLHVAILSLGAGVPIQGDPYLLEEAVLEGASSEMQRSILKRLVLTAINASSRKSAYAAFRKGWPRKHSAKELNNKSLEKLLNTFIAKHPHLEQKLGADQGIRLMNLDSQMANWVIDGLTTKGIPVLCVHDSFIVQRELAIGIRMLMFIAANQIVGGRLEISADTVDLDWLRAAPKEDTTDFYRGPDLHRSDRYLAALAAYKDRQLA